MTPCLLLLAAGAARRMRGADKLLEPVDGVPVLRVLCLRGLAAGLAVRVTVPARDDPRAKAIGDLPVALIPVPDRITGMAASIRRGLEGLAAPSVMILPADMPEITVRDLERIAAHPGTIIQATTSEGVPGHPVRFDAEYFPALRALCGDTGARSILEEHRDVVEKVALPVAHARTDLDTPEDWAAWRAAQGRQQ